MKKIFSSLLAIVAVMSLTLALSSCEKDKEEVTIRVTWELDYYGKDAPTDVQSERAAIADQISKRTKEIFGESFSLEADAEKARPTQNAIHSTFNRFENDSQIKSYMQKFVDLNTKDGKQYVTNVVFTLYCGQTVVGTDDIKLY